MRTSFLIKGEFDESIIRKILDPIMLGINRETHKVVYRTNIGIVEYVSIPVGSSFDKNGVASASGTLRKISLWNRDGTEDLEEMLQSKGIAIEKAKDGSKTMELKK